MLKVLKSALAQITLSVRYKHRIYNMENNYIYRFIQDDELPKLVELFDTFNVIFETPVEYIPNARTQLLKTLTMPYRKHVGCFDTDGNLLCSVSGYFPKNKTYWYAYNYFSKTKNVSLAGGFKAGDIMTSCIQHMAGYAESIGLYMFYTRRPAVHTFLGMRIYDRIELRYHWFHDEFYPAKIHILNSMHSFYEASMYVDSIVTLHVLKQEHRQQIFAKQHPQYQTLINKYT